MNFVKIIYLSVILGICTITDWREKKIKNCWVTAVLLGALFFRMWSWDGQSFGKAVWWFLIFAAVLFPLYCIGTIGAGDVKLLCVTAIYIGEEGMETFLTGTLISGGIFALVKLVYYRNFFKRMQCLWIYLKNVIMTGEIGSYEMSKEEAETLRLALPVWIGGLCWGLSKVMT